MVPLNTGIPMSSAVPSGTGTPPNSAVTSVSPRLAVPTGPATPTVPPVPPVPTVLSIPSTPVSARTAPNVEQPMVSRTVQGVGQPGHPVSAGIPSDVEIVVTYM